MKRRALLPLLACLLASMPALAQDGKIFPYDTQVETLDNGLKVVLVPMSSGGLLSYWTIVRTGSRDEVEDGRTGFAHFFEHMMFRGTEKYPADAYGEVTTEIGADSNAFTTDDLTGYYLNVAGEDLEKVMDIESDRFIRLSYPLEMFQTEAGAVYGEYRKNRTNPFFTLFEAVHAEAFKEHTYGHTTMGYEADIKNMPQMFDYSQSFFDRFYRPENIVLLLIGDLDVDATMELARRYYGEWEAGYQEPEVPAEPEQTEERRIDVDYDGSSLPIIWISYKTDAFDPNNKQYLANDLLSELVFGETSEIYKKLVLEEDLVEFIAADQTFNRDPGLFDIYSRIKDPEKVDYVISEIDRVIAAAQTTPPDEKRLADLKSRLKYDFLMGLDTPANVANNLVRLIAVSGGITAVDELYRTYETITPADVRAAAGHYLQPTRRTVAVLRGKS